MLNRIPIWYLLSIRIGSFKIVPVSDEESNKTPKCQGVREAKLIEAGKLPVKTAKDFLNEL